LRKGIVLSSLSDIEKKQEFKCDQSYHINFALRREKLPYTSIVQILIKKTPGGNPNKIFVAQFFTFHPNMI